MLTPKGFLVRDLHFWISLRRSAGVGKMRAVMMPSPPALETALANSAYPTYWNRSPESVFSSLVHRGEAARWFPSHRGATTCHLGDHESVDGNTEDCQGTAGRTGTRTIIPPCTTGTAVLVSRLSSRAVSASPRGSVPPE